MAEFEIITIPLETATGEKSEVCCYGEIVAPGLAITPEFYADRVLSGRWVLTHVSSGQTISGFNAGACIDCLREYATVAAATAIDWTGTDAEVTAASRAMDPEAAAVTVAAMKRLSSCGGASCHVPDGF